MFILDFLSFVAFGFWYNLVVLVVLGFIAARYQYDREKLTLWCIGGLFVFGIIEAWNILVWIHSLLHATPMG